MGSSPTIRIQKTVQSRILTIGTFTIFTIFITMVSQEVNVSFFIQKALTEDSISSASA